MGAQQVDFKGYRVGPVAITTTALYNGSSIVLRRKGSPPMNQKAADYFRSLQGKNVYFLGAGVSHRQLIKQFAELGANVTLCDIAPRQKLGAYADEIEALGVTLRLGPDYLDALGKADIVFRSPGIDYTKPEIQAAVLAGVPVTSEIETFFALCPAKTIGVTGSDGKTTTTTLIAEMLKASGYTVHLGGNIGIPLLPVIDEVKPDDIAVVELSSFQLISMRQSPDIAVVTNVTPNHLDHHKDMAEYIGAKHNIIQYQEKDGIAVLNANDDITRDFAADVQGELRWFSDSGPVDDGAFIDERHNLVLARQGTYETLMNLDDIKLPGAHNRENVATAAAAVMDMASMQAIKQVAAEFPGVEHRIELVREKDGVRWYNDSIGTSPTRTIAGLRSFDRKLILLAGGYDKKISYAPLAPEIVRNVRYLLLCGDTGPVIRAEVERHPDYDSDKLTIEMTDDIAESVARANAVAQPGDIVLLSPASASFDAYPNFEARGNHYKELVREL